MRKKLLTLGALALAMSMDAQFLSYVGDKGQMFVKEGALVFNGGGIKTVGTGVIDNSGNVMIVGKATDKFETRTVDGARKTDGGNFILRMTDETIGNLRYGQLYIDGITQTNITGVVDKEYKEKHHGEYQQIGSPFHDVFENGFNKQLRGLALTPDNVRWSKEEILVWNNDDVLFEHGKYAMQNYSGKHSYYAVGTKGLDLSKKKITLVGQPFTGAESRNVYLEDAAKGVDYGKEGNNINRHREFYNSYIQDAFHMVDGTEWEGNYGKNLYQFSNPYLTNLDFGKLNELVPGFVGARVDVEEVVTDATDHREGFATQSTDATYVVWADGELVGDTDAVIRPLQTFVIKTDGAGGTLDVANLRSFSYEPKVDAVRTSVTENTYSKMSANARRNSLSTMSRSASSARTLATSTQEAFVKQVKVSALDANGNELGRTYYYVTPNATTGIGETERKRQVTATSNHVIGTFEEDKNGGYDQVAVNKYWLYINEANENDFRGKEVPLALYSDAIKSLKFELKEDNQLVAENASLSNGESFYIKTKDGEAKEIRQGMVIPATSYEYGLLYGAPVVAKAEEPAPVVEVKREATELVLDAATGQYKLLFASDWKTATVQVFNLLGRKVSEVKVDAKQEYTVTLPANKSTYVIRAISDTGAKFDKKVKN